jgi:hypothetical protein
MKNSQKGISQVIILAIAAIIIGMGVYFYTHPDLLKGIQSQKQTEEQRLAEVAVDLTITIVDSKTNQPIQNAKTFISNKSFTMVPDPEEPKVIHFVIRNVDLQQLEKAKIVAYAPSYGVYEIPLNTQQKSQALTIKMDKKDSSQLGTINAHLSPAASQIGLSLGLYKGELLRETTLIIDTQFTNTQGVVVFKDIPLGVKFVISVPNVSHIENPYREIILTASNKNPTIVFGQE